MSVITLKNRKTGATFQTDEAGIALLKAKKEKTEHGTRTWMDRYTIVGANPLKNSGKSSKPFVPEEVAGMGEKKVPADMAEKTGKQVTPVKPTLNPKPVTPKTTT